MLTSELARSYSEQIFQRTGKRPSVLISEVHRKYCDLNRQEDWSSPAPAGRAFHREYHGALKLELERLLSEHGWALLLDIHGQSSEPYDLMVGIREGDVIGDWSRKALWDKGGVLESLRGEGFAVVPDRPEQKIRFGGGFIVRTYGTDERVEAWQLEHGGNLRFDPERYRKFVALMAGALAVALANGR
jgi:N-formylglutamate amidohydrolase